MKRSILLVALPGLLAGAACTTAPTGSPPVRTKVFDLGPMKIDRIFHSMDGPYTRERFDFSDMDWVTGFRSEVIDASTGQKLPDEFFCHSQMQLDNDTRLLVTATGIPDIRFPEGFGIPLKRILAGMEPQWRGVTLFGMVLNNHDPHMDRDVKVRLTVEYKTLPEEAVPPSFKKLYKVALPMAIEPKEGEAGEHHHHPDGGGAQEEEGANLVAGLKQHWLVPPGRQVTRKEYADIVPVDSTVHFALIHLHNYGVSMRLTDLTEGRQLWQTEVVNEPGRVQIAKIPAYSSATGFPVYKGHRYEIEAVYDNTTDQPVDAMAMMYLFYHPAGNEDVTYPDPPGINR